MLVSFESSHLGIISVIIIIIIIQPVAADKQAGPPWPHSISMSCRLCGVIWSQKSERLESPIYLLLKGSSWVQRVWKLGKLDILAEISTISLPRFETGASPCSPDLRNRRLCLLKDAPETRSREAGFFEVMLGCLHGRCRWALLDQPTKADYQSDSHTGLSTHCDLATPSTNSYPLSDHQPNML